MENELVGVSKNVCRIRELIERVAETGLNTVVCGETGVGKELVVQSLYQKSDRMGKAFVKVNCAALPDSLLESEMFGYEQGAFTGAEKRRRGKFEQANGGVLFLDEIGDMSLPLQAKLLHVLQGGDFTPLGSEKAVRTDAWVIAATNHELEKDLTAGKFREDLYFRLSAIKIYIEPLRNRPEDIPHLIDYYIRKYRAEYSSKDLKSPRPKVIERLCAYNWPGNVRELQNMLKRIMILGDAEENINGLLAATGPPVEPAPAREEAPAVGGAPPARLFDTRELSDLSSISLKKMRKKAMDQVEREVISYVLEKTAWNRSKATKLLKISYKTLLYKIKDLGIQPPPDAFD
jgi:transcriptional regulator with PAS, ATPase and Fis domain